MWRLVVSICVAAPDGPACVSGLHPGTMASFAVCADAAVVTTDVMRAAAQRDGSEILSLNTRCIPLNAVRAGSGGLQ
ncbi:hypothetical protein SAMN04490248_115102 [Salinihabitans flavidus]|uniref:Uncharacterized protein n=1 Tax=Salinihabitans flavidus TaxID=569882 RepID=A0A1H8TIJ9_9RHOB|nr:hypothetical protein [Salinihabitans flavidus]SEO90384.1 hypothetical protein SAMN04490248_115102 [Salinihabitans flavidus]